MQEDNYLVSLLEDFTADSVHIQGRKIQTVFIGGGTPSLMSGAFYKKLFSELENIADFEADTEITLEANPGASDAVRFAEYREAGITRLSIGIQSFNDQALVRLGRVHDSSQAAAAIKVCREAKFNNFNLDLMYGLPAQSIEEAMLDLKTAIDYQPSHLSWYQLTIEPNTVFYNKPPMLPDEEKIISIQNQGLETLNSAGLKRYETSAYSKSGKQSKHNLNYWSFGDYLGIGAGAHGKVSDPEKNQIVRIRKVRQPGNYIACNNSYVAEQRAVKREDLNLEFLMNAFRLTNGFDNSLFQSRTGNPFSDIEKRIRYLQSEGLLEALDSHVVPTPRGQLFVNSLLEEFL